MNKRWFKAAAIRAVKTVAQTAVAVIGTLTLIEQVDWVAVVSSAALAGVLSFLTSLAGLPEAISDDEGEQEEQPDIELTDEQE